MSEGCMVSGPQGRRDGTVAQGHGHACSLPGTAILGRKWRGIAFVALTLVACHPGAPAKQDGSWAAFNGFYPGMSLKEAQNAGAKNCRVVDAIANEIGCDIPPEKLVLGPWTAKEGHLEFFVRHAHRLSRMRLHFRGPHFNEVCLAVAQIYGKPVNDVQYLWHEARTPALISSQKTTIRGSPRRSLVEFKYEPELADPRHDFSLTDPRGCLDP